MNEIRQLASEITARYGVIKRARGCFLYTAKGIRLTDLYQEGGRAVLGWGGSPAFTVLKNVLSRGLTGSFDSDFVPRADGSGKSQLSRAVGALLGDTRSVQLFSSRNQALQAALSVAPESTSFYRPWTEGVDWACQDAVIVEPPLAFALPLWILALKDGCVYSGESSRFASPLIAAVTRSIYDLQAAVRQRQEKDWFIYDTVLTRYWVRRGPYLYPKIPEEQYAAFVRHCLEHEIVVSPVYNQPSIVPFGADRGVFRKLEKNPFSL